VSRLPLTRYTEAGDDLVPNFDLTISGRDAGKSTQLFEAVRPLIASVTYEEDEEMAGMFTLQVINQPEITYGSPDNWRAVVDSKAFQEGNAIDLYMGYGGVQQYMGRTEIVKWLPVFEEDGPTIFTIKAYDGRHRMMEGNQHKVRQSGKDRKRKSFYKNLPDELIVKKIAEKYGYGVDYDATESKKHSKTGAGGSKKAAFPTRVQNSDTSDWVFLQRLAEINRFDLWVSWSTGKNQWIINFKKRQDAGQAEYLFTYNGNDGSLISAQPDFSITDQPTDVEVLHFDRRKRTIERSIISDITPAEDVKLTSASPGNFQAKKTIGLGARVRFSAFGQVIEAFSNKPFRSKAEAETFAQHFLKERERDFLVMTGKVVGIETLRPRQVHQLAGLGARLDGFYRFTKTRHVMQPGNLYQVEFMAHKILSQEIARRKATTTVQTTSTPQAAG